MSLCAIAGAFLLAFWLTFYVKDILLLVTDIIFAPLFKLKVKMVSLFGLTFFMEEEKWKISFLKPELLIQHDVKRDTRKHIEGSDGNRCLHLNLVQLTVIIIAAAAVCFVFRGLFFKRGKSAPEYLAVAFACGMVFQVLWRIHVIVCTHLVFMKKMGGYIDSLLDRIRSGKTFTQLDLKPIDQLGYKNITIIDKKLYYPIYMSYLAETGKTWDMHQPSGEMMEHYRDKEANLYQMLTYYWLIYYYSAVEPNKVNADLLMEKIGDSIYDDKCANGKRVLAYYTFAHEHDLERAEELVTEGFAALESGNLSNAEKILERSLLTQLNTQIINSKFNTNFRS